MSKKTTKILALLLAVVMVVSLAACGKKIDTRSAADPEAARYNADTYDQESADAYKNVLGDFAEAYAKAKEYVNEEDLSTRWALMAAAEGKMLGSAIMIPLSSRGGIYGVTRVAPRSVNTTLWGSDEYRRYTAVVVKGNDFLKNSEIDEIRAAWGEKRGTGTYEEWLKGYLTGKGYELDDEFNRAYTSDPVTFDVLASSRQTESEPLVNTYDGLYAYDMENEQQPALATSYEVSDDGLTYTFHLREGVKWVDSQGREVADVKADDWVAAMQHMMDAAGGLEYLVGPEGCNIKGASAYMAGETDDFSTVGVKAIDDLTLEYTLEAPCTFFMTMLSYSIFAPMSRDYYTSQGGKFGADYDAEAKDYAYGKDPDHIAYCGPFLITNATAENTIKFQANETYYNAAKMNVHSMTWYYWDGTDELKAYNDAKAGTTANANLQAAALEQAKKDGLFDDYAFVSATDATSFMGFFNVNRYAFANFNDQTVAVSSKTVNDAERTLAAMQNLHFRRALLMSLDRGAYNAQDVGEELKYASLINTYTPGNFVSLTEDVTIDINGTPTEFKAGTYYGEIMQAQLDADGVKAKVWDPEADGGIGSSAGFDGWYNAEEAAKELETAVKELKKEGVKIDADNPIYLDLPTFTGSETYKNKSAAFKQSVENATGGFVIINIVDCENQDDWLNAGYYFEKGYDANFDINDLSGWGPDYGDPQTYLDTMLDNYAGYMVKSLGMY